MEYNRYLGFPVEEFLGLAAVHRFNAGEIFAVLEYVDAIYNDFQSDTRLRLNGAPYWIFPHIGFNNGMDFPTPTVQNGIDGAAEHFAGISAVAAYIVTMQHRTLRSYSGDPNSLLHRTEHLSEYYRALADAYTGCSWQTVLDTPVVADGVQRFVKSKYASDYISHLSYLAPLVESRGRTAATALIEPYFAAGFVDIAVIARAAEAGMDIELLGSLAGATG